MIMNTDNAAHAGILHGSGETVLVADDDESLRKLTKFVLNKAGYRVIEAVDGDDALQKFQDGMDVIRLVIADLRMPKKNGNELCLEIIKIRPGVRILMMSGQMYSLSQKFLIHPGVPFILKPVMPADLLQKVREVLDA